MKHIMPVGLLILTVLSLSSCQSGYLAKSTDKAETTSFIKHFHNEGVEFSLELEPGKHFNYPTFAIWIEDMDGSLIQTVFVTKSIASGYYKYGDAGDGTWLKVPGEAVRPAALPYWLHKREGTDQAGPTPPTPQNPIPDAFTGATPSGKMMLNTKLDIPPSFRLLLEVNQAWDWNEYWTNSMFPGNSDYKTSAQPSLIYAVTIRIGNEIDTYHLNPIGHGHFDGSDGLLYTDLSTLTTALQIFNKIVVNIR